MTDQHVNLDAYFERIGYSGSPKMSSETLYELHLAHTTHVPFENLDVFYRKPIRLDEASLYQKIVIDRRGGYCFEMNGIFAIVLERLGFKVTNLLARGVMGNGVYTAKTHQALLVEFNDQRWLADVGYGNEGIMVPLQLEKDIVQDQFAHTYRLVDNPVIGLNLQKKQADGTFQDLYAFTLTPCYPVDFTMSNHFTSTHPDSFFTIMRMCTMPTTKGRVTLTDQRFKVVENNVINERELSGEDEYSAILNDIYHLNIDLIKQQAANAADTVPK